MRDSDPVRQAVEDSENKYRALIEYLTDLIIIIDRNYVNVWNSPAVRKMGLEPEDAIGVSVFEFAHVDDHQRLREALALAEKSPGTPVELNRLKAILPDDRLAYLDDVITYLPDTPGINGYVVVVRNVTSTVLSEESLRKASEEKDVLLRELHHRVKNNLQIITSLLFLQSKDLEDESQVEFIAELRNRVNAMAILHQQLDLHGDLASVRFSNYVSAIVSALSDSFGGKSSNIELSQNIGDCSLDADRATTCGLLINEILSNSFKHAFSDGKDGRISIKMTQDDNDCVLTIEDNGVGFEDPGESKTMGLELIQQLCAQLRGSIKKEGPPGTRYTARFPV